MIGMICAPPASVLVFLLAAVIGCQRDTGRRPASARNVILISVDTLRADHLSCYGYTRPTSPAIDRLASEGILFTEVTSVSPWTLPSHATLLTGLYPSHHGVKALDQRLSADTPSLATVLAARGFNTIAVVNSFNLSPRFGFDRGFEFYRNLSEWGSPDGRVKRIVNRGREINRLAIERLDRRDERPFFMFLHYYDVHSDYAPDAKYRDMFVRPYTGRINGMTGQLVNIRARGSRISQDDRNHLVDLYDAEIRQFDDVLAELKEYLERSRLAEDTLIILTSDHGEEFMDHGSLLHGRTCYQEMMAVPLIMRGPGIPGGLRSKQPVSLVDVAPTVVAGVGHPHAIEGEGADLAGFWLDGESPPGRRRLYAEADHSNVKPDIMRMVRLDSYKLCYNRLDGKQELYDLESDPREQVDLVKSEPKRLESLMKSLEAFMAAESPGESIGAPSGEELDRLRALGYVR